MEKPNLSQLKELLAKATPGPWIRSRHGFQLITADEMHSVSETGTPRGLNKQPSEEQHQKHLANLDLIVAAVNALPSLLAEREALRYLVEKFRDKAVRWSLAGPTANGQTVDALRFCADELEQILEGK